MGSFFSKSDSVQPVPLPPFAAEDVAWEKDYPFVFQYLACQLFDDNTPRRTSTLSISTWDRGWRVCLNDRERRVSAFFTAETILEALRALDNALGNNRVSWRANTWEDNRPAMRKKA